MRASASLLPSGHSFYRPSATNRAAWLAYDGPSNNMVALFTTNDSAGARRLYRSRFPSAPGALPSLVLHAMSPSDHNTLAASTPSRSYAVAVDANVERRAFDDTAIPPTASSGSVVQPTMIGGLFGNMTYVRSHMSGSDIIVTGFGCTP